MADRPTPRHKRLTEALCEAVEFGRPTKIRMSHDAYTELLASIDSDYGSFDMSNPAYENVPIDFDDKVRGCVVEHDSRYTGLSYPDIPAAAPETVVITRDRRKPAIVAW